MPSPPALSAFHPAVFLSLESRFLRQAAVVRSDVIGAEPLGELVRHALGETRVLTVISVVRCDSTSATSRS
jgi:hypothetical protein